MGFANIIMVIAILTSSTHTMGTTSKGKIAGLGDDIIGDIVPSTYPVLKFNQSVNSDGGLSRADRDELDDLRYQILQLTYRRKKAFENLRLKTLNQTRMFNGLANFVQQQ